MENTVSHQLLEMCAMDQVEFETEDGFRPTDYPTRPLLWDGYGDSRADAPLGPGSLTMSFIETEDGFRPEDYPGKPLFFEEPAPTRVVAECRSKYPEMQMDFASIPLIVAEIMPSLAGSRQSRPSALNSCTARTSPELAELPTNCRGGEGNAGLLLHRPELR